jgi:hypothetical protein
MVNFNKPFRTGLGQGTNLVSPNAPVQSLDQVPNNVLNTPKMSAKNTSDPTMWNRNSMKNSKASTKTTGGRAGGKNKNRVGTKKGSPSSNKGFPLIVPPINSGNPRLTTTTTPSDMSYDISGSGSGTAFSGIVDNTLYKDWNRREDTPSLGKNLEVNGTTSYTKMLDTDFEDCVKDPDYQTEWSLALNSMIRDIIRNTNASSGALSIATETDITKYIHEVSRLFTFCYEFEVMLSWNPEDHKDTNAALRFLAQQIANETYMDVRTRMRESLRSHVLPEPMLRYMRWLREYKLQNAAPESSKLALRSKTSVDLVESIYNNGDTSGWLNTINNSITAIEALDPRIPALLLDKVDCINFVMVKDYYANACNHALYDSEYNNIYNNRLYVRKGTSGTAEYFPQSDASSNAIVSLNTQTPLALSLTNLYTQIFVKEGALPLENRGGSKTHKCPNQTVEYNHFIVNWGSSQTGHPYEFLGISDWFQTGDDTTWGIEYDLTIKGIAIPRGDTLQMFYPSKSNIGMAKRLSFAELMY